MRKSLSVAISLALCWSSATAEVPVLDNAIGATVDAAVANAMGGQNLNINQSIDRAVLEWQSFNIGANDAVNFNQPSSSAIALNRVLGATPSQIYGDLTANGRVFILNNNGVLFGNGSSVNVRGLLTTMFDIDNETFYRGIENNIVGEGDSAQLMPAMVAPAGGFDPDAEIRVEPEAIISVGRGDSIMLFGSKVINEGELYTAEGQIILAAAEDEIYLAAAQDSINLDIRGLIVGIGTGGEVINTGNITAERGNVTLMGLAVNQSGYVRATTSVSLDGSIVLKSEDYSSGGIKVDIDRQNNGQVLAGGAAGDVTLSSDSETRVDPEQENDRLALLSRVENSIIESSGDTRPETDDLGALLDELYDEAENLQALVADTDALLARIEDASITVDADQFAANIAGSPELTSSDALEQARSLVDITGRNITLESGALVAATGGVVQIDAFSDPATRESASTRVITPESGVTVTIEDGAVIDVSGDTSAVVSVGRNYVDVDAFSNELADSPEQRDGVLRGQTLTVDVRDDVDILNIEGARSSIERTVSERLGLGGEINIRTNGTVEINSGSTLDISGGSVTYTGDDVSPSQLIQQNGEIVDIADADPEQTYIGVAGAVERTDQKWGVTESWGSSSTFFEDGYVQGYDAGSVFIETGDLVNLDGQIIADTVSGRYQREGQSDLSGTEGFIPFDALNRDYTELALGGQLQINQINSNLKDVIIGEDDGAVPIENGHPVATGGTLVISPELLTGSGLSRIEINNAGRIILNRDLSFEPFVELELMGTQVLADADIESAGGSVRAEAHPTLQKFDQDRPLTIDTVIGSAFGTANGSVIEDEFADTSLISWNGTVDLTGRWQNDSSVVNPDGFATAPLIRDGGTIQLVSAGDLAVSESSVFDVSGGAQYTSNGKLVAGSGGDISLLGATLKDNRTDSDVSIGAELRSFSLTEGGRLSIQGEEIRVVNSSAESSLASIDYALDASDRLEIVGDVLNIDAEITQLGGFSSYSFTGALRGLSVADDTAIELTAANLIVDTEDPNAPFNIFTPAAANTGSNNPLAYIPNDVIMRELTSITRLIEQQRSPVDFTLNSGAFDIFQQPLLIGEGVAINGEIDARVELIGGLGIEMYGEVNAPSGEVILRLSGNTPSNTGIITDSSLVSRIWLGETASINVDGAVVFDEIQDVPGLSFGQVLDAGSISLLAPYGSIVTTPGSMMSADATSSLLAFDDPGGLNQQIVGGDAGVLTVQAAESLLLFGGMNAQAAAGQNAGEMNLVLDPSERSGSQDPRTQTLSYTFGERFYFGEYVLSFDDVGFDSIDGVVTQDSELPTNLIGQGYVPLEQFDEGGFETLNLTVRNTSTFGGNQTAPHTADSITVIEFADDVDLVANRNITFDAAVLRATSDVDVSLSSDHVVLGSQFDGYFLDGAQADFRVAGVVDPGTGALEYANNTTEFVDLSSTTGDASLTVDAKVIDLVGELVTRGFGQSGVRTVTGNGIEGDADINLTARELRLIGVNLDQINQVSYEGLFRTAADIIVDASRVYPVTITDYKFEATGANTSVEFTDSLSAEQTAPLSLGGSLEVTADLIEQDGNLYAPLGEIDLSAMDTLYLTGSSLTATSAADVEAPFFTTESNSGEDSGFNLISDGGVDEDGRDEGDIVFVQSADGLQAFERLLPSQNISLTADQLLVSEGALFDIRNGTASEATQFQPGPGGTTDILLAENAGESFAIVPGITDFAPVDPSLTPGALTEQGIRMGDTLVLEEGTSGLPAGEYAILPARYALFGGYLVTPESGTSGLDSGLGLLNSDGTVIVAGRYGIAGTENGVASRSQGFEIATADVVRNRAEYVETPLADLYTLSSLRSPNDAGTLNFEAISKIELNGQLVSSDAVIGRGSEVNVAANQLTLVSGTTGSGDLEIEASRLEGLGADSILIGGRRTNSVDGQVLEALADQVTVEDGVSIDVNELLLLADTVDIQSSGSSTSLSSSSAINRRTETLLIAGDPGMGINGDAALVAISNQSLSVQRTSATSGSGSLNIDDGVTLTAAGSIVADTAGTVTLDGDVAAIGDDARIVLGANSVSLGETDGQPVPPGITLSNETLTALDGVRLVLRSDTAVRLYSELINTTDAGVLDFNALEIDADALISESTGTVSESILRADSISLRNTSGNLATAVNPDSGNTLAIETGFLRMETGDILIDGFSGMNVTLSDGLLLSGTGGLRVDGDLALSSPVITGASVFNYSIDTLGSDMSVTTAVSNNIVDTRYAIGSALTLSAGDLDYAGNIALPSGTVTLRQTGDINDAMSGNDLLVAEQSVINVAGVSETYGTETVYSDGGRVRFIAETGDVEIRDSSVIDVSPGLVEGEAGSLDIVALGSQDVGMNPVGGRAILGDDVGLMSQGNGGDFSLSSARLQVGSVSDDTAYTSLSVVLGEGFSASRNVRLVGQGITHEQGLETRVHQLTLVSDESSININGSIDASGQGLGTVREDGGKVVLAAGDDINIGDADSLNTPVRILVTGTVDNSNGDPFAGTRGGKLELIALDADDDDASGVNDQITMESDAIIDLSGGADTAVALQANVLRADQELGGEMLVHTRVLDRVNAAIQSNLLTDANVIGASRMDLVLTIERDDLASDPLADGRLDSTDISALQSTIDSFMTTAFSSLGTEVNGFAIRPGLLLEYDGTISVDDEWNFYGYPGRDAIPPFIPGLPPSGRWYYNDGSLVDDVAGLLTLRATGSIEFAADLTDSVYDEPAVGFFPLLEDRIGVDKDSWSFNLIAGADAMSADLLAYQPIDAAIPMNPAGLSAYSSGSIVTNNNVIRTGTGDISISAAGDIDVGNGGIYTLGYDQGLSAETFSLFETFPGDELSAVYAYNEYLGGGQMFPINGGDLEIISGADLLAAVPPGEITEWQPKVGEARIITNLDTGANRLGKTGSGDAGAIPTHWGINVTRFSGLGALGGGTVKVDTEGDIQNVAIVVPTVGRSVSGAVYDSPTSAYQTATETTEVAGGGILDIDVGGSVQDLQVVLGDGSGSVEIASSLDDSLSTVELYSGFNSVLMVDAVRSLKVNEIRDPGTVLPVSSQGSVNGESADYFGNQFFTYSDDTTLDIAVLTGELTLDGLETGQLGITNAVPPQFSALSLTGDLILESDLNQFPSAVGQLALLAHDDVLGTFNQQRIRTLGYSPSLLPTIETPDFSSDSFEVLKPFNDVAVQPLHVGDEDPSVIIARNGDVRTVDPNDLLVLDSSEAVYLEAGRDISNLTVFVTHNNENDISSIIAGRDILQPTNRSATGFTGVTEEEGVNTFTESSVTVVVNQFEFAGEGDVEFIAGRTIDLGTSDGIETIGNLSNSFLPEDGANLTMIAGVGGDLDIATFVSTYLTGEIEVPFFDSSAPSRFEAITTEIVDYRDDLDAYLAERGIAIQNSDAVATFLALEESEQHPFVLDVLFSEIRGSGNFAVSAGVPELQNIDQQSFDLFLERNTDLSDLLLTSSGDSGSISADVETTDGGVTTNTVEFDGFTVSGLEQLSANETSALVQELSAYITYSRGYDAVYTLTPQSDPDGGISMLLSQAQTIDGGDIDILVPGGLINAGSSNSDIIAKSATSLGMFTEKAGDVNIYVDQDLLVNSTRVFSLQGDLTIWSGNGNIDAGKGAKTVASVPSTEWRINNDGEIVLEASAGVQGSGLQGVNAFLFAPAGVINASDAGISTSGNLTLGATAVLGADNIDVGGVSVGVPTAAAGVGASIAGAGDATSSATSGATDSATEVGSNDEGSPTLGILSVNLIGFGDETCTADSRSAGECN